jgi:4-amino-4-deoxy-L-arabinose transferase-like glycosyltransferase
MQDFFDTLENRVYTALSFLAALSVFFFAALQVSTLSFFKLNTGNDVFYALFSVLAALTIGAIAYFSTHFDWKRSLSIILLVWFPAVIVLTYAISESKNFHYIFQLAVGGYVILAGALISAYAIMKEHGDRIPDPEALSPKAWLRAQGLPTLLLVLFATTLFFSFGFHHLTKYAAVDEPLWLDGRIHRYWKNIGEHDWRGTNISDKPGITVALVTGPGTLFKSSKEFKTVHYQGEVLNLKNDVESYYFAFRFPELLFITLMLPLFYFFLERLIGRRSALMGFAFLATSPILVGMAKIINPDSLLWLFTPLSLISYLVFRKRGSFRYLIFSGIFLGLALLTKYVANILFVFYLGLIFLEYLFDQRAAVLAFADHLKRSLKHLAILTFTALTTFYALFPAVWVKPEKLLKGTVLSQAFEKVAPVFAVIALVIFLDQWLNRSRITSGIAALFTKWKQAIAISVAVSFLAAALFTVFDVWAGMRPYDFMDLLASPKTIATRSDFIGVFLTNFYPFLFGIVPLSFLLLFATPFFFLKKNFAESIALRTAFYLIVFILLYYLGATVNGVASIVRYQIILFPMAAIISGIALEHILVALRKRFSVQEMPTPVFAASAVVFIGAVSLFFTPYPLSYASTMLPASYHTDVKDMGAGSYEAAMWLNSRPGAENMLIWTDKDGVCKFFVGRCKRGLDYQKLRNDGLDYIVTSAGRESRTGKMMAGDIMSQKLGLIRFDQYYNRTDTAHEIDINSRKSHFVKIFKFEE